MRIAACKRRLVGALLGTALLLLASCSDPDRTSSEFCDRLGEATGTSGAELALVAGDPARIAGVVEELTELHDRAPEEMSATTRTLLNFFRDYQQAARDERRDVLAENETALINASSKLDDYALNECGLFLQRAVPTPRPTVDPNIDAPDE